MRGLMHRPRFSFNFADWISGMIPNIFRALSVAALVGLATAPALAMSVSPNEIEMISAGAAGRTQITVTNSNATPLPIETSIQRLDIDENGKVKTAPAGDEFLVFPPQAMIPAGGTQVFRIQWVGEPNLDRSRSYMMSVTQIALKLPKGQSGIRMVSSFGVVINVAPPQGKASLKLISTGIMTDPKGKRHATVTIENPTNVHGVLEQSAIRLTAGSWSKTYGPSDIAQKIGIGIVQPGKRRKFILPDELPANTGKIQARLDYTPAR